MAGRGQESMFTICTRIDPERDHKKEKNLDCFLAPEYKARVLDALRVARTSRVRAFDSIHRRPFYGQPKEKSSSRTRLSIDRVKALL